MRPHFVLGLLASTVFLFSPIPTPVVASHDPIDFVLLAQSSGWNNTSPPRNPQIIEFKTVPFTARINRADASFHNFALYTANYAGIVSASNPCDPTGNTPGCITRSVTVDGTPQTTDVTFTPAIPPDDGSGLGGYEYYCEFHASFMHGRIRVYKDPDLNENGQVDLPDAVLFGQAYNTIPSSPSWNAAADFNNDHKVNIFDAAILGRYYPQVLVD